MKTSQRHGKISDHFTGLGTVTSDVVVARAREIALINGRRPNQFTQEDFEQAKGELTGDIPETNGEAEEEVIPGLVTWDEPPQASGRISPRNELEDEMPPVEVLTEEGIVEAEHDSMVEGARALRNQK